MLGRSVRVLLACLGLLAIAQPAHADCVSECQASTYCDSDMTASGECSRRLNDCYADACNRKSYGAIAYGYGSGAVGWSYDFGDAPAAEKEALRNCKAHGDDCQVVVDFWNTCAAVAADQGTVSYGLGDTEDEAEQEAVLACEKDGGSSCDIAAWACAQ